MLTNKQQIFIVEYLVDLNATAAAIRAGYSARTAGQVGFENLKKPEIAAAIEGAMKDRERRTQITQDEVIQGLRTEAKFEGQGSSHGARVAAWAHLGRHLGMFIDYVNLGRQREINDLSDDELQDIILEGRGGNGAAGTAGGAKKPRKVH